MNQVRSELLLQEGEEVVIAWPETCSGPGWLNHVVWVIIRAPGGAMRRVALQSDEQNELMRAAFTVCEAGASTMTSFAKRKIMDLNKLARPSDPRAR